MSVKHIMYMRKNNYVMNFKHYAVRAQQIHLEPTPLQPTQQEPNDGQPEPKPVPHAAQQTLAEYFHTVEEYMLWV